MKTIKIDKTYYGKELCLNDGDHLVVQLEENPTTGYLWDLVFFEKEYLKPINKAFELFNDAVGSGGLKTYSFEIISKGKTELRFSHSNPWEKDIIDDFKVTVTS